MADGTLADATAEWEAGQEPVFWPGLGTISTMAARMLLDGNGRPSFFPQRSGDSNRCYGRAGYTVHVQPWCRCNRRKW